MTTGLIKHYIKIKPKITVGAYRNINRLSLLMISHSSVHGSSRAAQNILLRSGAASIEKCKILHIYRKINSCNLN